MAPEPLTPSRLILMKSKVALPPPGKFVKEDMYAALTMVQSTIFKPNSSGAGGRRVPPDTSRRQKWHVPWRNLKVNDIVIIKEDTLPRNQWQLGRVVEIAEGTDGLIRQVKVQVGERKLTKNRTIALSPQSSNGQSKSWCFLP